MQSTQLNPTRNRLHADTSLMGFLALAALALVMIFTGCKPPEEDKKGTTLSMEEGKLVFNQDGNKKTIELAPGSMRSISLKKGKVFFGKASYNFSQLGPRFWDSPQIQKLQKDSPISFLKKDGRQVLEYTDSKGQIQEIQLDNTENVSLARNPDDELVFFSLILPCLEPVNLINLMEEEELDEVVLEVKEGAEGRYAEITPGIGTVILDADTFRVGDPGTGNGDPGGVGTMDWTKVCDIDLAGMSVLVCTPCIWVGNSDGWCCIPFSTCILKVGYDSVSNTLSIYKDAACVGKVDCCDGDSPTKGTKGIKR